MIRPLEDVAAPAVVSGINLGFEKMKPEWDEWAAYITAGGCYIAAAMNAGGNFVKNMGIAAFPWAVRHIATRAGLFSGGAARVVTRRRVSRYPATPAETDFENIRMV